MSSGPLHEILRDGALRLRDGLPLNPEALAQLAEESRLRLMLLQERLAEDPSPPSFEDLDEAIHRAAEAYADAAERLELAASLGARGEAEPILARVYEAGDLLRAVRQIADRQRSDLEEAVGDFGWTEA